jgi:nucleoside-diphosphate-sugar epimerase
MRVFVTGASGWVGRALIPALVAAGHRVVGLARSDSSADALAAAGVEVHRGSLEDPDSLHAGAAKSDGVVHLAFNHDFTQYEAANETDRRAIETIGAALEGSGRPLVIASGVNMTTDGATATETDPPTPGFPRSQAALIAIALSAKGVRSSVVRLPPTVHGRGDKGFIATLVGIARERGVSGYIGDGSNVWPAVHRDDAARVFQLALEQAPPGSMWHAIAEEGIATRSIAEEIGRQLDVPAVSIPLEDVASHFGWTGLIWSVNAPTSSELTRWQLRWQPAGPSLIEDLEAGHYFRTA